ncbi:MAG: glycosyltransferase [Pseudomonadota bacterium]
MLAAPVTDAPVTFFTVSDSRYFLGVTAMVNSLRICGHTEEIVVLDCGLTPDQRQLLRKECSVRPLLESRQASHPTYYKLSAPRAHSAEKVVLIDSDMIVTGHLGGLLEDLERGKIVGYPDPEGDRWFGEWEKIFELPGPPRQQSYMNAGFVAFSRAVYPELLEDWWNACSRTLDQPATTRDGGRGATAQGDQDALNAVLMSRYPKDAIKLRNGNEAPQAEALRRGVKIINLHTLACEYRGERTLVLHQAGANKPWRSVTGMRKTAFVDLMRRLLNSEDIAIRPAPSAIPFWLKGGMMPRLLVEGLHWRTRGVNLWKRASWRARSRVIQPLSELVRVKLKTADARK